MAQSQEKKLILVIGATGEQGMAVVDALLAPREDGSASPYAVRALTRDPDSRRAKELTACGVKCVKGTPNLQYLAEYTFSDRLFRAFEGAFDHLPDVAAALEGAYGAWVNTDGFTVGEQKEIYAGMRIFEIAKMAKTVRHYVYSNLDYALKVG